MRVCFRSSVQPELMAEYKQRHAAVWPEMLSALKEAGWNNYSLFLAPDGQLIGYLECEDYQAAQARMALTDVNTRWQAEMATLFAASDVPRTKASSSSRKSSILRTNWPSRKPSQ